MNKNIFAFKKACLGLAFFFLGHQFGIAQQATVPVVPQPKEIVFNGSTVFADSTITIFWDKPQISKLYGVLQEEINALTNHTITRSNLKDSSTVVLDIIDTMAAEEYHIDFDASVRISSGSYKGLAMATVTFLQAVQIKGRRLCWLTGDIHDFPDFGFRGLLLDVARNKHSLESIKTILTLCRWYKINYLQLHLTDDQSFTFPSEAYPELATSHWSYTREELQDLVTFATNRGIEIIPEFELPGHAGQLIKKMPEVFGFTDPTLNRSTVNMANDKLYVAADILYQEIADIFPTSNYIHIGGDEANFRGMEDNTEIQNYLKQNNLQTIEELYWHFINRMHEGVKKAGKKTIVWEGFAKEGNHIIDKDITVMAWETLYQLPQDILDAGFKTLNVSWKPLYVVNERKWEPEDIFNWNIFRWENFWQVAPSFNPIQLDEHPGIIGAMMASWEQPEHVQLSSLRHRIPALIEESWGHSKKIPFSNFKTNLTQTDNRLSGLLTPIKMEVDGLTHPEINDGRKNEQDWFGNEITVTLRTDDDLDIKYTLDSSKVNLNSNKYYDPLILDKTSYLRYRAFRKNKPIGREMLDYFELKPLKVDVKGDFDIPLDQLWTTTNKHTVKFYSFARISVTPLSEGIIRYAFEDSTLNENATEYQKPIVINNQTIIKIGLFRDHKLIGEPWIQKFEKVKK